MNRQDPLADPGHQLVVRALVLATENSEGAASARATQVLFLEGIRCRVAFPGLGVLAAMGCASLEPKVRGEGDERERLFYLTVLGAKLQRTRSDGPEGPTEVQAKLHLASGRTMGGWFLEMSDGAEWEQVTSDQVIGLFPAEVIDKALHELAGLVVTKLDRKVQVVRRLAQ